MLEAIIATLDVLDIQLLAAWDAYFQGRPPDWLQIEEHIPEQYREMRAFHNEIVTIQENSDKIRSSAHALAVKLAAGKEKDDARI